MLGEKLQKAVLEAEGEPSLAKCAMNAESLGEFIATDTSIGHNSDLPVPRTRISYQTQLFERYHRP